MNRLRITRHVPIAKGSTASPFCKGRGFKVRDCSVSVFPELTKLLEGRYPVLPEPDDSRNERRQFLVSPEIRLVHDRIFHKDDSHGLNHPIRWQVSEPDNKNPGYKDRWDAAVGICNVQSFDFEVGAREYVRNPSRFCGDNADESLPHCLTIAIPLREKKLAPHLNPLPAAGERRSTAGILRRNLASRVSTDE